MSNTFSLNWLEVQNAFVWVALTAIMAILVYVIGVGNIFEIDVKTLVNIGVMSFANGLLSLLKSFLTTKEGRLAGIRVK